MSFRVILHNTSGSIIKTSDTLKTKVDWIQAVTYVSVKVCKQTKMHQ